MFHLHVIDVNIQTADPRDSWLLEVDVIFTEIEVLLKIASRENKAEKHVQMLHIVQKIN